LSTLITFAFSQRELKLGADGFKPHPLYVVKGSAPTRQWRRSGYQPRELLLAPGWCLKKWNVLNCIEVRLKH
jgi:radical SAM superfamily enzyme